MDTAPSINDRRGRAPAVEKQCESSIKGAEFDISQNSPVTDSTHRYSDARVSSKRKARSALQYVLYYDTELSICIVSIFVMLTLMLILFLRVYVLYILAGGPETDLFTSLLAI